MTCLENENLEDQILEKELMDSKKYSINLRQQFYK